MESSAALSPVKEMVAVPGDGDGVVVDDASEVKVPESVPARFLGLEMVPPDGAIDGEDSEASSASWLV